MNQLSAEEYGIWTAEQWTEWVFILGLKLDQKIPFMGIDNRKRIEHAVLGFVER